jgi:hypothetical protein
VAHQVALGDFDVIFLKRGGDSFQRHALTQKIFNDLEGRPHDQSEEWVILLGKFNFFSGELSRFLS